MKADISNEHSFIAEVAAFQFVAHDIEEIMRALDNWLEKLIADLQAKRFACDGLTVRSALAREAGSINAMLRDAGHVWFRQWAELEPAQALADYFDDKALLLVFGKFNAGKSSFCNFIADRFAAHGKPVQYFHLEAGGIAESSERFQEGTTETTTRLQGVRLGENLVLLDTPGLHSMTPENAALTQRFTDSADAVLWLTSSTSPGQVQELDDIGRELHRNKPLLPIVTRSDAYDEDEVDGEIVKRLCNKSASGRELQEADIKMRAEEKLVAMGVTPALLKTPVSISVHVAREQSQTPRAMAEAGFERLYCTLIAIAEPTLAYKRRKLGEILLHHLEENVLGTLRRDVVPLLDCLDESSQAALDALERQEEQIAKAVWRTVAPTLPEWLETHAEKCNVMAIRDGLAQSVFEAFSREANEQLADYVITTDASLAMLTLDDDAGFDDIVVEHAGESRDRRQVVGVDYQRLHAALGKAIRESLLHLCSNAVEQCSASIEQLLQRSGNLRSVLKNHELELLELKRRLRSEFS